MGSEGIPPTVTKKASKNISIELLLPELCNVVYKAEVPEKAEHAFPQFRKFPPEIRRLIWSFAPMPGRKFLIHSTMKKYKEDKIFTTPPPVVKDQKQSVTVKDHIFAIPARLTRSQLAITKKIEAYRGGIVPIVLWVCHESRQVGLRQYQLLFDNPNIQVVRNAYIDYEKDLLAITNNLSLHNFCAFADFDRFLSHNKTAFTWLPQTKNAAQKKLKHLMLCHSDLDSISLRHLARFQSVENLIIQPNYWGDFSSATAQTKFKKKLLEVWQNEAAELEYEFKKPLLEQLQPTVGYIAYNPSWWK